MAYKQRVGLLSWIDRRFPLSQFCREHLSEYYAPKNFNFWYLFGVFSLLVLVNQIATGIWLTMYYTPTAAGAFASIEHIMRDVRFGWLLRYMHSTGASAFFVVLYLHIYRGIMYGSYKAPRELIWLFGCGLYLVIVMEAASGYVLPWGQMSFWAIKVLISVCSVIPWVGQHVVIWLQGDYNVSGITLHRFFAFHVILLPLTILVLVVMHVIALHAVGSNNPDGVEIKKLKDEKGVPLDGIPFHPFYTVKDLMGIGVFLFVFFAIVFFAPSMGGYFLEAPNFIPANILVTPGHIAPPWYLASFYSILRCIPNKLAGVSLAAGAIALLFVLPWLDRSRVLSIRYKGVWSKVMLAIFVVSFIGLGYLGTLALSAANIWAARIFTVGYYLFFLAMPFYSKMELTKTVPSRVTMK